MYLDLRSYTVLRAVADNPAITGKELEQSLQMSRKQLSYDIEKINYYLESSGFEPIVRLKTGRFQIAARVVDEFRSEAAEPPSYTYNYSDEERSHLIILRLLCRHEELSTYHFTDELQISKNTLMTDMRKIQERIKGRELSIVYTRKDGYRLDGSEYRKRVLMIEAIRSILAIPGGMEKLKHRFNVPEEELIFLHQCIGEIEKKLGVRFTDDRLEELPCILYFIILRITNWHTLKQLPDFYGVAGNAAIQGTQEYEVMKEFAGNFRITSVNEVIYLTTQILVSNIKTNHNEERDIGERLLDTARQIIGKFEELSCTQIREKEELLNALLQHLGPAYYRLRYHYHVQPDITDMVLPQYGHLHQIAKRAVKPFENMLGEAVPDKELVYITVLFGAWLRREGRLEVISQKRRAIVVCTNGISVSNFLFITLRELFPELDFIECMSVRDFRDYREDYQIIFTTVRLETDRIQFMVSPILSGEARKAFRKKVMGALEGYQMNQIDTKQLMDIIEAHADIRERDELLHSLGQYFNAPQKESPGHHVLNNYEYRLKDVLTEQTIQIEDTALEWRQAIRMAAAPLLAAGKILPGYIEAIIGQIERDNPFIMVEDGVIIAHAGVDDGVVLVGMSLLVLPARISIDGYMDADVIVMVATPDPTSHLNALYQLFHVLEDNIALASIRSAKTVAEAADLIAGYRYE